MGGSASVAGAVRDASTEELTATLQSLEVKDRKKLAEALEAAAEQLTLYWALMSQPSRAIKGFFVDSGIPFKDCHIDMLKGENYGAEFRAVNPSGLCPCLTINGKLYTETIAIMRYVAVKYPSQAGKFYPDGIEQRYQIDKWCDFYTSFFRPSFIKEYDVKFSCLMSKRARNDKDEYMIEKAKEFQVKAMKQLEQHLEESDGKFIVGDALTLADYVIVEEMQDLKVLAGSEGPGDYPRAAQYEADVFAASAGLSEIHKDGSPWNSEVLPAFKAMMQ